MTDWWIILVKAFWCGWAATGFGILFNTPRRALTFIWLGGFTAGLVKFVLLSRFVGAGIVFASFSAAGMVGILGLVISSGRSITPVIFSIPSVIPLVPGAFAYRTVLGLMKLSGAIGDAYQKTLAETVRNGVLTLFVVMAIAIGIVIPMIIVEKTTGQSPTKKSG